MLKAMQLISAVYYFVN